MTITAASISAIIQEFAPQVFVDAVTKDAKFIDLLRSTGRVKGPSSPQGPRWYVETDDGAAATTFAEGDAAPAASTFTATQAQLGWGNYTASFEITGLSEAQLAVATTTYIEDYVAKQLEGRMSKIAQLMNTHALAGANANGITGITAAIADANTYAGINRGVVSNWQAYVDTDVAPRAISDTILEGAHDMLTFTIGGNYSVVLTSATQARKMAAIADTNLVPALQVANGERKMEQLLGYGGFDNGTGLYFHERPVIALPNYPSGRIDLVNLNGFWIEELVPITIQELAKVNLDSKWQIYTHCQLVLENPRKQSLSIQNLS